MRQDTDKTDLLSQSHGLKRISLEYGINTQKTTDYKIIENQCFIGSLSVKIHVPFLMQNLGLIDYSSLIPDFKRFRRLND